MSMRMSVIYFPPSLRLVILRRQRSNSHSWKQAIQPVRQILNNSLLYLSLYRNLYGNVWAFPLARFLKWSEFDLVVVFSLGSQKKSTDGQIVARLLALM